MLFVLIERLDDKLSCIEVTFWLQDIDFQQRINTSEVLQPKFIFQMHKQATTSPS